jgi:hypothetical protein
MQRLSRASTIKWFALQVRRDEKRGEAMSSKDDLAECARMIARLNGRNRIMSRIIDSEQQKSAMLIDERNELLEENKRINQATYKMIALCAKDRRQRDQMRACLVKGMAK